MKRLILLALCATSLFAETREWNVTLTAAGTTGAFWSESHYHTVTIVPAGSPSGCTARLEGSLDKTTWFDLSTTQTCTSAVLFTNSTAVTYVRVNLLTWTGGTGAAINYKGQN
jgi:hypothetical protein